MKSKPAIGHKRSVWLLERAGACEAALRWIKRHRYNSREAYNRCRDAFHLTWFLRHLTGTQVYAHLDMDTAKKVRAHFPYDRVHERILLLYGGQ